EREALAPRLAPDELTPPRGDREDRDPRGDRQPEGPGLAAARREVLVRRGGRPLRRPRAATRVVDRRAVARPSVDRDLARTAQDGPDERGVEQLLLGEKPGPAPGPDHEDAVRERVQVGEVVPRDDG